MARHDDSVSGSLIRKVIALRKDLETLSFNYLRVKACGGQMAGPLDGIDEEGIRKLMALRDDLIEMLPFER